jgi:outer membrane murein-binding lipoprotein Lpp
VRARLSVKVSAMRKSIQAVMADAADVNRRVSPPPIVAWHDSAHEFVE